MTFHKGDIVRVEFKSAREIERWMNGERAYGPGDVGVVKYMVPMDINREMAVPSVVTVTFPMIGTFGVACQHLQVVGHVEVADGAAGG